MTEAPDRDDSPADDGDRPARPGRRAATRLARLRRAERGTSGADEARVTGGTRLNKLLASRGLGARRKCDALIQAGSVRVNGTVIKEPGTMVMADRDRVEVHGRVIPGRSAHRYVMVHKPVGVITTLDDPDGRPTIRGLLPPGQRLFPVGRLDAETSGLIIATNDGDLAHHLMHPRYGVRKLYRVRVDRPPDTNQVRRLRSGVEFEPRVVSGPCEVRVRNSRPGKAEIEIVLHEGRYRQVRRMCEAVGLHVQRLHRPSYGPLRLGTLPRGTWRDLTAEEVRRLRASSARPVPRLPARVATGKRPATGAAVALGAGSGAATTRAPRERSPGSRPPAMRPKGMRRPKPRPPTPRGRSGGRMLPPSEAIIGRSATGARPAARGSVAKAVTGGARRPTPGRPGSGPRIGRGGPGAGRGGPGSRSGGPRAGRGGLMGGFGGAGIPSGGPRVGRGGPKMGRTGSGVPARGSKPGRSGPTAGRGGPGRPVRSGAPTRPARASRPSAPRSGGRRTDRRPSR